MSRNEEKMHPQRVYEEERVVHKSELPLPLRELVEELEQAHNAQVVCKIITPKVSIPS